MNSTSQQGNRGDELSEFARLLDLLGIRPDERISICSLKPGGKFQSTTPVNRKDAESLALAGNFKDHNVWFSVNPVEVPEGYYGRGGDEHVTRCVALPADIDIKAGGVPDPEAANRVAKGISTALGVDPVAVVFSGHGGHPYWALDPDDDAWTLDTEAKRIAAQTVYRRFHRLCDVVAAQYGCGVDNVSQLSRILRVPGTLNVKDPDNPVPVELTEHPYGAPDAPLTYEQVCAALDAYPVPERPEDREVLGEVVKDSGEWEFGDTTHPYVTAMVKGWVRDVPNPGVERHNWMMAQVTRLACAHRVGSITEDDYAEAVNTLESAFLRILAKHGEPRVPIPANEFDAGRGWGVERASRKTDEQAAEDLGVDLDGTTTLGEKKPHPAGAPVYPPQFWDATQSLRWMRDAALANRVAPDVALMVVLAQLSARIPPGVRVDTGIMRPLPLHLFGALVSRTGKGKTSAMKSTSVLADFRYDWPMDPYSQGGPVDGSDQAEGSAISPVQYLIGDDFPKKGQIRTGEGIAEMYYGKVRRINPATEREFTERGRVRTNVLMTTDEGASLVKHILDDKSTVGETVRMTWSGSDFGQSNAGSEKYRFVPDGEYTLAMLIVFHLGTLADLLSSEQLALGTPQRFLYAWARPDLTAVTEELVASIQDPGPLPISVPRTGLRLCRQLREQINTDHLRQWLSEDDPDEDPVESQRVAMISRTAGLLAIINGRDETDETGCVVVPEQDWELAAIMFQTSCDIARIAVAERRFLEAARKRAARETDLADSIEDEDARSTPEGRVKARIIGSLRSLGPGEHKFTGKEGLLRRFNTDDAKLAAAVLPELAEAGRVAVREGARGSRYVTFLK